MANIISNLHSIVIRQRKNSEGPWKGYNTEVLLDGKLLKGVCKASFSIDAKGFPKIQLEICGDIKVTGDVEKIAEVVVVRPEGKKL